MPTTSRYKVLFFSRLGLLFFPAILLFSCRSNDKEPSLAPLENLFFHYDIQASEEWEEVTLKVQFRREHVNGPVVRPAGNPEILLDGQPLLAGESRFTGPYYEIQLPQAGFTGTHRIEIRLDGKTASLDSFYFEPLGLRAWPDTLRRENDLRLELTGLGQRDQVLVLLTDTAFAGDGLERQVRTRENGLILLPAAALASLAPGPLQLQLTREYEDRISREKGPGGAFTLQYQLSREGYLAE